MDPSSEDKVAYTPESRKEMYLKQAEEKLEKDKQKHPEKYKEKKITPELLNDGKIR